MSYLFGVTARDKAKGRIEAVKLLSEKMNANYTYGTSSLQDHFNVDNTDEEKDSNVIVGSVDGYPYCFVEYYHIGRGKNEHSRWISYCSLRLKSTCPNFEVSTISSAQSSANTQIVVGCIFLLPSIFCLIFIVVSLGLIFKGRVLEGLLFPIFPILLNLAFGFFAYNFITSGLQTKKEMKNQSKYDIRNHSFKDKYVILSEADPYKIKKIFTDEVCEGIVNAKPEVNSISVINNCINMKFDRGEMLEYNFCNRCLNTLVSQAELFKLEDNISYLD